MSVKYLDSSALPLAAMISMFIGHSLGVVPVCQLIASEVRKLEVVFLSKWIVEHRNQFPYSKNNENKREGIVFNFVWLLLYVRDPI